VGSVSGPPSDTDRLPRVVVGSPPSAGPAAADPEAPGPRWSEARIAVRAVAIALVLGAFTNGPALIDAATGLAVGPVRQVALAVAGAVDRVGAAVGLDQPRRWFAEATGATAADPVTAETPDPAETEPPVAGDAAVGRLRPVSAEDPLRVLLVGDSLVGAVADGYGRVVAERDDVRWTKDVRVSTGLARPDVLDWSAHLRSLLLGEDPDVVVVMIGGNDGQSLTVPGGAPIHHGSEPWPAAYEERAGALMDVAASEGRTVLWIRLPAMRVPHVEQARQRINAAVARAAEDRPVRVIDGEALLTPEGYTPRLGGQPVRADDGVHLSIQGGERVAAAVAAAIEDLWGLP
jgi:uncharacterized protein